MAGEEIGTATPKPRHRAVLGSVAGCLVVMALAGPASAQTDPATFEVVPGTTTAALGEVVTPLDIVTYQGGKIPWAPLALLRTRLPAGVEIDAFTVFSSGVVIFSTDTTFSAGGIVAQDEDLVRFDGATAKLTLFFDGSVAGLPPETDVDAFHIARIDAEELLISLDGAATVGSLEVLPSDIMRHSSGAFSVAVAGHTIASHPGFDIDGLTVLDDDSYLISIDTSLEVGTDTAGDADLLHHDPSTSATRLYRDLSALGFPEAGVGVKALDVQYAPGLSSTSFSPAVVCTIGTVTASAVYTDADGEAPVFADAKIGATWKAMAETSGCGAPLCDRDYRNGERFRTTLTSLPAGASSVLDFRAGDGRHSATATRSGPAYISGPGDADGDGDVDASDLARVLAELADGNSSASIGAVRTGGLTDSWGGTDADGDNVVGNADIEATVARIY